MPPIFLSPLKSKISIFKLAELIRLISINVPESSIILTGLVRFPEILENGIVAFAILLPDNCPYNLSTDIVLSAILLFVIVLFANFSPFIKSG